MIELLKVTTNSGRDGLVLVGTVGPVMQADEAVRGEARHAGRTQNGQQVYIVDRDDDDDDSRWVVVILGTVECIEGAAIIASEECESANKANLIALRSEALLRVNGYAQRKGYRLYINGTERPCGNSDAVLLGLGIRNEQEELRETPTAPVASSKFRDSLARAGYKANADAD